jgi:excisionase family DNA binding protein
MAPPVIEGQGYAEARSERLLRVDEVAKVLAISERSVHRLVDDGAIAVVRIGRSVRFDPADVHDFVANQKVTVTP